MGELEEKKDKSKEMIGDFADKAREFLKKTEEESISLLDGQLKESKKILSRALEEISDSQNFSGYLRTRALNALKKGLASSHVRDDSVFVLGAVKRCIDEHIDCTSLESFLTAFPVSEMLDTAKGMKGCLAKWDGKSPLLTA